MMTLASVPEGNARSKNSGSQVGFPVWEGELIDRSKNKSRFLLDTYGVAVDLGQQRPHRYTQRAESNDYCPNRRDPCNFLQAQTFSPLTCSRTERILLSGA
jgi:hypothetical protein